MRVNVYAEEMTLEVQLVTNGKYSGVRFYLRSPDNLLNVSDDYDRSAVTFWGVTTFEGPMLVALDVVRKFMDEHRKHRLSDDQPAT